MIETRNAKLIVNKSGGKRGGSSTFRATLPTSWVREMGLNEENRNLKLEFNGKQITITNRKLDIDAIENVLEIQNLGIDFESFNTGDELADWLDGRYFPEFVEPIRVSEHQREALNEIYKQR